MRIKNISHIIKFTKIDSTQNFARKLIENKLSNNGNILIIAKKQTGGRGQKDNKWSSREGGLYFSFITTISKKKLKQIQNLSIITAEIISEIIFKKYRVECYIKHPNDVYVKKNLKKISGILIETIPDNQIRYIITGVGINFNNKIPNELKEKATSIYDITKKIYNPDSFLKLFFEKYFIFTKEIYD